MVLLVYWLGEGALVPAHNYVARDVQFSCELVIKKLLTNFRPMHTHYSRELAVGRSAEPISESSIFQLHQSKCLQYILELRDDASN